MGVLQVDTGCLTKKKKRRNESICSDANGENTCIQNPNL